MAIDGYYLGCPMWGMKDWVGTLYTRKARSQDYLAQYARVFNAVEGNTTFYSTPPEASVAKWREAVPESFRFAFKIPREVTHELGLEGAVGETLDFLERMEPLGPRLGPFMIQLPPSFGPDRIEVLDRYLRSLPAEYHYAVELRHRGFYENDKVSRQLNDLLALHGAERIVMDTRAMRSGDPSHPDVQAARRKKPSLPVDPVALGPYPMVRLICHPDDEVNEPWFEKWSALLARWMAQGRRPMVFMHCPNDVHSPRFARRLHTLLSESAEVGAMPAWPGEEDVARDDRQQQLSLW